MALYESEHTKFMREMLAKNPEWVEDQRRGRAIWWDKTSGFEEQKEFGESREAQRAYPYDVNFERQ
jgi:hypothetical protein